MITIPPEFLDWKYQARIDVINPNADPLYQSVVVIPWTPGMNQDFSDLRFLHPRTEELLPYWIESKTDGSTATIWIRGATTSTVTVLFGNPAASSESDGEAVFEFFDDFPGDSVDTDKWTVHAAGGGSVSISGGIVQFQTGSGSGNRYAAIEAKQKFGAGHVLVARYRSGDTGNRFARYSNIGFSVVKHASLVLKSVILSTNSLTWTDLSSTTNLWAAVTYKGSSETKNTASDSISTSFRRYQISRVAGGTDVAWDIDGIQKTTHEPSNIDESLQPVLGIDTFSTSAGDIVTDYADWIYVRKYAAIEPVLTFVPDVEVIPFGVGEEGVFIILLPFEPFPSNEIRVSATASARLLPPRAGPPDIGLAPESLTRLIPPTPPASTIELLPATLPLTTYPPAAADEIDLTPGALPPRISFEISQYKFERLSITRSIQDALWVCTGTIDGHIAPNTFQYFSVKYPDRSGIERVLFYGFIPGRERITAVAGNKTEIQAYDASYYLTRQLLPPDDTVYPAVFWSASGIINELLGGANWARRTGIRPYSLDAPDYAAYPQKDWEFRPLQSHLSAILDVAEYHQMIFLVKTRPTSSGSLEPSAYFVRESQIDWALGLPPMVTFTGPDNDDILDVVRQQLSNDERYNHIEVYSPSPTFEGVWFHAVKRTPGLIAGTEIPLEYREIRPDFQGSAALCEARATELYNYYIDPAYSYVIRLLGRVDLELYQQVKFVGFSSLPTDIMRITRITYDIFPTHAEVEIEISPSSRLADARRLQRSQQASAVSEIQTIARAEIEENVEQAEVGTIVAIDGAEVQVETDRGVVVKARRVSE